MICRTGHARFPSSTAVIFSVNLLLQVLSLLTESVLTSELPSLGRASLIGSVEPQEGPFSLLCNFHGVRFNSTCYCSQDYQGVDCARLRLVSPVSVGLPAAGYLADGEWRHHFFHGRRGVMEKGRAVRFLLFADALANATAAWGESDLGEAYHVNSHGGVAGLALVVRRSRPGDQLRQDAIGVHTSFVDKTTRSHRHALKAVISDPGPWTWWISVQASQLHSLSVAYSLRVEHDMDGESESAASCPKQLPGTALPCAGHGVCIEGRCFCHTGFQGDDCSLRSQVAYRPITLEGSVDKGRHGSARGHVARNGWQHFYINSPLSLRVQMLSLLPARGDGAGFLKPPSPTPSEDAHGSGDGLRLYLRRSDPPTKKQHDAVAYTLGTWGVDGSLQQTVHELEVEGGGQHSWFFSVYGGSQGGSFALHVASHQACTRGCGDQGACVDGECLCRLGWAGPQCLQQVSTEVLASAPTSDRPQLGRPAGKSEWRFEHLPVAAPWLGMSVKKARHVPYGKETSSSAVSTTSLSSAALTATSEKLASVSGLAEAGRWRGYRLSFPAGVHPAEVRVELREQSVASQGASTPAGIHGGDAPITALDRVGMVLWRGRGVPPSNMAKLAPEGPMPPAAVAVPSGYGVESYATEEVPPGCTVSLSLALDWKQELAAEEGKESGLAAGGILGSSEGVYDWWVWLAATGGFDVGYVLDVYVDELAGHCPRGVAGRTCSGRGDCRSGHCRCHAGFRGDACQFADEAGVDVRYLPTGLTLQGVLAPCQPTRFRLVLPSNTRAGLASVAVVVRSWGEGAEVGSSAEGAQELQTVGAAGGEGVQDAVGSSRSLPSSSLMPLAVFLQEGMPSGDGLGSSGSDLMPPRAGSLGVEGGFTRGGAFEAAIERGLPRGGAEASSEWVVTLVGGNRGGAGTRDELALCHGVGSHYAHGSGQHGGQGDQHGSAGDGELSSELAAAQLGWGWATLHFSIRTVATLACLMDCAGAGPDGEPGVCNNGTCICPRGWGGDDCGTPQQPRPAMQGVHFQTVPAGLWAGAGMGNSVSIRPLLEWSASWWQAAVLPTLGNLLVVMALGLAACLLVSGALLFKAPHAHGAAGQQAGRGAHAGEDDLPDDRHYEIMGMDSWAMEPLAPATPSCSDEEPVVHHMNIGGCHVGDGRQGKRRGGLLRPHSDRELAASGAAAGAYLGVEKDGSGSGSGHVHPTWEDAMAWGYASSGSSTFYDLSTQGGDDSSSRHLSHHEGVGEPAPSPEWMVGKIQGAGAPGHCQHYGGRVEYRDCCHAGVYANTRGYATSAGQAACHRSGDGAGRGEGGLTVGYPAGACQPTGPLGAEFGELPHYRGVPHSMYNRMACAGGGPLPLSALANGGYVAFPHKGALSPLLASTVHGSLDNLGHVGPRDSSSGEGRDRDASRAWLRRDVHSSSSVPSLRHAPEDALPLRGGLPMANARPSFMVGGCDVRQRRAATTATAMGEE